MENSKNSQLVIEDNTYGYELKKLLWKHQYHYPAYKEMIELILKLINIDFQKCEVKDLNLYFTENEKKLFQDTKPIQGIKNKEVLARWFDVMLTLNKKNIRAYIKLAHESYMEVYAATSEIYYMIRSLALVKYAKSFFNDEFEEIFEKVKYTFIECSSAYYQQLILIELSSIYGQNKCQDEFSEYIELKINHFGKTKDFRSARFCIRSLQLIGILDKNQCNIRMAENYEAEGDQYVSEMEPNTYYPTISAVYLKGFRLIASTNGCQELHNRLQRKVAKLQLEDFRTIQAGGIRLIPEIDMASIHNNVLKLNLSTSSLAYHTLLELPMISNSIVEELAKSDRKSAMGLASFFSEQVKISQKGAQVASEDIAESYSSNARTYLREKLMAYIYFVKGTLDGYIDMNHAMVTRLLIESKSPFVPEDRLHIYSLGITAGFQNDFVTAAHLLIPQLENSLRHLAATNDIIVTTYEKRFHLENLLGGLIAKIRPLANDDIIEELDSFLVHNSNVNFRNELLHGLMETTLVHKYGLYAWWLCLKLILQTKLHFPGIK
ncbi:Uncharacterised protein [Chryseobacterium gleum]|uniref:DUF4209 domain-containing protein n=2 Tax=Chryseobacterium gleum TaxID=250 RepID=A0A448B8V9_CHRGE|nr:hypothetical protein [Chryseobacterium gleum]EFK36166.1 hypothetical protein HMPREF0204_15235 [Chryseobacterium gleum ATCC 35910]QQY31861.1 hypothetical protein I6I60_23955 [Chryseobacterium gleum]VEE11001.1 Uncharacterised protein [Chryseobacterium gleum]